ncbi:MAG: SEC-C metal-binding domain-containing protein, partial [Spirochaetota bacterium]|nr:SEC-C metal-binding domain-containing protein [Spirochaetota bacterium]
PVPKSGDHMSLTREEDVTDFVQEHLKNAYVMREEKLGSGQMRELERYIMLYSIDSKWKDHLYNMDTMKEGIHLRAYAERNPLTEYKLEASNLFEGLKIAIMEETLEFLYKVEITQQTVFDQYNEDLQFGEEVHTEIGQFAGGGQDGRQRSGAKRGGGGIRSDKVKRNDPCPCGSGKKYKVCCGR